MRLRTHTAGNVGGTLRKAAGWGERERQGVGTFSTHTYVPFIHLMTSTIWIRALTVGSCGGGGGESSEMPQLLSSLAFVKLTLWYVNRLEAQ